MTKKTVFYQNQLGLRYCFTCAILYLIQEAKTYGHHNVRTRFSMRCIEQDIPVLCEQCDTYITDEIEVD